MGDDVHGEFLFVCTRVNRWLIYILNRSFGLSTGWYCPQSRCDAFHI
ncbi:hypothetical protein HMPREF0294_2288 [Corynebacterium glucuronolyticum ATCC 51867]|uniref:Uncharacterized protein n=1 Tax=Corynebacterium glucuronolyticum ATCC 51866 TaxID=548478 RepID=A0ABM9XTI2_9CORY|nr:hypothetical protein HMPREF0294_2288 [Corynebacterium glucuronolyticum ATCC 51867]EEI64485.1 hypothetical protein HMPREF0293_0020 [Corynebacterium glucuronolyticum ATCC 51866]